MACWEIKNVRFAGVSACVPENKVRTDEIKLLSPEDIASFEKNVGIKERRIAPDCICASDMCQKAAEKLIEELGWDKMSIDILIFASVTGDYKTPPTACLLQNRIGLSEDCFCLDVPMGCCGYMYAINVAGNLLSSGNVKRALVLVGDTALRMGSMEDKSRVPLFGDAGTATALEYDIEASPIIIDFHTDGSGFDALYTPHGGYRRPISEDSFKYEDFGHGVVRAPVHALIDGMKVFTFAISKPPLSVQRFMEKHKIDKDNDIDYYLIHQANKLIVKSFIKKLKLPEEKVPSNLEFFGNLGGASIPSLMVTRTADAIRGKEKKRVLCVSFGLGLSWSTMMMDVRNVIVPELIELSIFAT